MDEIKKFIDNFKSFGTGKEIVDCFSNGNCFWFAYILKARFPYGRILYIPVDNHFVYTDEDKLYDITGDCTKNYKDKATIDWDVYQYRELGSSHLDRLIDDCILKR